ncbi:MAG: hypothetical protein ACAH10_03835 [Methylophilaceae bacterium]
MNKEICQQAYALRHQGHTYKQVGLALNVSEDFARQMVQINDIMQQRKPLWTEGLSARTGRAIRHAGFTSRQEVIAAFSAQLRKLQDCRGLGNAGIMELRSWLGLQ